MDKLLMETKIRMVMMLKKLTRRAAVREIARMEADKRKSAENVTAYEAAIEARLKEGRRRRNRPSDISRNEGEEFMSVEDLFA